MTSSEAFHPNAACAPLPHCGTMDAGTATISNRPGGATLAAPGTMLTADGSAPEWVELLPAGVFRGRDGRGPYRLADPAGVIAATQGLEMHAGIPIDYDHATDLAAPEGRPAPAAGWIRELAVRAGAIWGRVEWTQHGAAAVATHEYRYISPVFEHGQDGAVVRLLRAALTNNPNLYLTAIAAQGGAAPEANAVDTALAQMASDLCAILGIDEGSTPQAIADAVRALTDKTAHGVAERAVASGSADPAHYVPVAHFQQAVSELNTLRAERASERAEHAVAEAMRAGKVVPAQREWALAYCTADATGFANFVARQPALELGESALGERPAGARRGAAEASIRSAGATVISSAELEVCANLGIATDEYIVRKDMQSGGLGTITPRDRRDFGGAAKG